MPLDIEARYLGVEWLQRGRARNVEVSPDQIDIERGADGVLRIEALIFQGLHPWLGLRLSGRMAGSTPAFVDAMGASHPMLAIDAGSDGIWWVQDDGWDEARQRHQSELHRSLGRFEIRVDDQRLLIENVEAGIGKALVDEYLQDFRNELLWLVLGTGSATAAGRGSPLKELAGALVNFAAAARQVGVKPAKVLREVEAETVRSRLRPNAASFRQHARQPARRRLLGRASEESADTPDNRYLRHMIQVCGRLADAAGPAYRRQAERSGELSRYEEERAAAYRSSQVLDIDPEVFERQLDELKDKLDRLEAWSAQASSKTSSDARSYRLQISKRYGSKDGSFFFSKPEGPSDYDRREQIRYNVVEVPPALGRLVASVLGFCREFTLTGRPEIELQRNQSGNCFRVVRFLDAVTASPDRGAIDAKLRRKTILESNGWQRPLSRPEYDEQQREARTATLRADTHRRRAADAEAAGSQIAECRALLRHQDARWNALGVKPQPRFPTGMRYVLSPDYSAAHQAFVRVRQLADGASIGDSALDALNRIGVLHASAIYERWCLVKIVDTLMQDFRFEPDAGWQDTLIRAATGRPDSASLDFRRSDVEITATLEIQPVLPNGRRPDFRLRICGPKAPAVGLVLDAKFRGRWHRGELTAVLTDLIETKGYGQQRDRVFILQPQAQAVAEPTSPLAWGRHCDYGQDDGQNHIAGTIRLSAGPAGSGTQQNLRRLIALGLQAAFAAPEQVKDDGWPDPQAPWESCSFCVRCGARHTSADVTHKTTKKGNSYWILACESCRMTTVRTHCFGNDCSTTLFKNGHDLTYHRTLADQVTNVACPNCGTFFDQDFLDA